MPKVKANPANEPLAAALAEAYDTVPDRPSPDQDATIMAALDKSPQIMTPDIKRDA